MSSTNRANAVKRSVADYYVTPQWCIRDFLCAFQHDFPSLFGHDPQTKDPFTDPPVTVLDPCAGGDEKNDMAYPAAIANYSQWKFNGIDTIDIRPDSRATFKEDYLFKKLAGPNEHPYDIAITNPPFNIALDVIKKCLREVQPGGFVIMLLRLNFFGSQERSEWFKLNMPSVSYVHSKRISFAHGATDSIEYQHAVWWVGARPRFTKLRII